MRSRRAQTFDVRVQNGHSLTGIRHSRFSYRAVARRRKAHRSISIKDQTISQLTSLRDLQVHTSIIIEMFLLV